MKFQVDCDRIRLLAAACWSKANIQVQSSRVALLELEREQEQELEPEAKAKAFSSRLLNEISLRKV